MKNPITFTTKNTPHLSSAWQTLRNKVSETMNKLERDLRVRSLQVGHVPDLIDLAHNDYLGLRYDTKFIDTVDAACKGLPVGSGGSRLLGGEHPLLQDLETQFNRIKGSESSLYYTSGYAANEAICRALYGKGVAFFSDELNHASIIDGMRISKIPGNKKFIFKHNDLGDLKLKLKSSQHPLNIVITESVFSMDGDRAPLKQMKELCDSYNGLLIIDEAHALGVLGSEGNGCLEECGIDPEEVITINPCGKGLSGSGAFITGPSWFREYLINTSRGFIFTTAPSPRTAQSLIESIQYVRDCHRERKALKDHSDELRTHLKNLGFNTGNSTTHIIPIVLGSEAKAMNAESFLREKNIICKAIRPPTVPIGECRLRLSLHAGLKKHEFAHIKESMKELSHVL